MTHNAKVHTLQREIERHCNSQYDPKIEDCIKTFCLDNGITDDETGGEMSDEKTTAYWLHQFAVAAERDKMNWHHEFQCYSGSVWRVMDAQQLVLDAVRYPHMIRHKPRRITLSGPGGTFSYPEPVRDILEVGSLYYFPDCRCRNLTGSAAWRDILFDRELLRRGRIHLDEGAAREHAEAEIFAQGGKP